MGADPMRWYTPPEVTFGPSWPPEPGFHACTETDWRDWSIGVVLDLGPDEFGFRVWLGPWYLAAWYRRDTS